MEQLDVRCNLCGENQFRIREDDEPPFRVLECRRCGLVFVHPLPDPTGLAGHYDENYYRAWITEQKDKRSLMWENRLRNLEEVVQRGHLLDVGCGDGSFLSHAKQHGWVVDGTEYSDHAAKFAGERVGIHIFRGELASAVYPGESYDVVTMWHVLEHVADPGAYLREIHRILKPSGLLVMAVPNVDDWVMQTAYRLWKGRKMKLFSSEDREVHLYHFSPSTLQRYLAKTGFRCLQMAPDCGIVEDAKRFVNWLAILLYHLTGHKIYNAIEAWAVKK
jgi:2-polyprenyl-3-methyl-5-hydroxy-6-metoxy-1,4-benzoquinol methylase